MSRKPPPYHPERRDSGVRDNARYANYQGIRGHRGDDGRRNQHRGGGGFENMGKGPRKPPLLPPPPQKPRSFDAPNRGSERRSGMRFTWHGDDKMDSHGRENQDEHGFFLHPEPPQPPSRGERERWDSGSESHYDLREYLGHRGEQRDSDYYDADPHVQITHPHHHPDAYFQRPPHQNHTRTVEFQEYNGGFDSDFQPLLRNSSFDRKEVGEMSHPETDSNHDERNTKRPPSRAGSGLSESGIRGVKRLRQNSFTPPPIIRRRNSETWETKTGNTGVNEKPHAHDATKREDTDVNPTMIFITENETKKWESRGVQVTVPRVNQETSTEGESESFLQRVLIHASERVCKSAERGVRLMGEVGEVLEETRKEWNEIEMTTGVGAGGKLNDERKHAWSSMETEAECIVRQIETLRNHLKWLENLREQMGGNQAGVGGARGASANGNDTAMKKPRKMSEIAEKGPGQQEKRQRAVAGENTKSREEDVENGRGKETGEKVDWMRKENKTGGRKTGGEGDSGGKRVNESGEEPDMRLRKKSGSQRRSERNAQTRNTSSNTDTHETNEKGRWADSEEAERERESRGGAVGAGGSDNGWERECAGVDYGERWNHEQSVDSYSRDEAFENERRIHLDEDEVIGLHDEDYMHGEEAHLSPLAGGENVDHEESLDDDVPGPHPSTAQAEIEDYDVTVGSVRAISRQGDIMAVACGSDVRIIEVQSRRQIRFVSGQGHDVITSLQIAPQGTSSVDRMLLYTGSDDGTVCVYEMETGRRVDVVRCGQPIAAMHVHQGTVFMGLADGQMGRLNFTTTGPLLTGFELPGHATGQTPPVCTSICSTENGIIFAGTNTGQVGHYRTGKVVAEHVIKDLHKGAVTCLQVEGEILYSGSEDMTIHAFDWVNNHTLFVYDGHRSTVSCLQVCDGYVFSGSDDGTVRAVSLQSASMSACITADAPIYALSVVKDGDNYDVIYGGLDPATALNSSLHRLTRFNPLIVFVCEWRGCVIPQATAMSLHVHVANAHFVQSAASPGAATACKWANCGFVGTDTKSLSTHLLQHTGGWVCGIEYDYGPCGACFFTRQELNEHQDTEHQNKLYPCAYGTQETIGAEHGKCPRVFSRVEDQDVHTTMHILDQRCEICGERVLRFFDWIEHMYRHGSAGMVCAECSRIFHDLPSYRNHVAEHPTSHIQSKESTHSTHSYHPRESRDSFAKSGNQEQPPFCSPANHNLTENSYRDSPSAHSFSHPPPSTNSRHSTHSRHSYPAPHNIHWSGNNQSEGYNLDDEDDDDIGMQNQRNSADDGSRHSREGVSYAHSSSGSNGGIVTPPTTDEVVSSFDPYFVLEVESFASEGEIRRKYRSLCLRWHPDRLKNVEEKKEANVRFQKITWAYEYLKKEYGMNL